MTWESVNGCPARVDIDGILTDPFAELARCASEHWYADGLGMTGEPMRRSTR